MSDLTNQDKIEIMLIASKQFHIDADVRINPTKDIIELYHAMITAITGETVGLSITITGVEEYNGTTPTTGTERPFPV